MPTAHAGRVEDPGRHRPLPGVSVGNDKALASGVDQVGVGVQVGLVLGQQGSGLAFRPLRTSPVFRTVRNHAPSSAGLDGP